MSADEFILENSSTHLTLKNENYSIKTVTGRLIFD